MKFFRTAPQHAKVRKSVKRKKEQKMRTQCIHCYNLKVTSQVLRSMTIFIQNNSVNKTYFMGNPKKHNLQ